MTKGVFRFKRFEVRHMCSSMPVGTDAVLLGAWTRMGRCAKDVETSILDIGCGCGLIALMAAQRSCSDYVIGIDVDAPSVEEAAMNAIMSPFASRVKFLEGDVRDFACRCHGDDVTFSLILCNPPYYTEKVLPPDTRRSIARNTGHLSFSELLDAVRLLLDDDGVFSVVVPMQVRDLFVSEAVLHRLYLARECRVQTVVGKQPKRVLMEFSKRQCGQPCIETLVLQDVTGGRTLEYARLCGDFYL